MQDCKWPLSNASCCYALAACNGGLFSSYAAHCLSDRSSSLRWLWVVFLHADSARRWQYKKPALAYPSAERDLLIMIQCIIDNMNTGLFFFFFFFPPSFCTRCCQGAGTSRSLAAFMCASRLSVFRSNRGVLTGNPDWQAQWRWDIKEDSLS